MKSLTSTAIVALTAGIIGISAMTPAAFAQQQPKHDHQQNVDGPKDHRPGANGGERGGMGMMRPGLLDVVCSENGADRLEIAFLRLSQRIDPTTEQQAAFDALKSAALSAQAEFAKSCAAALPAKDATADATAPRDPIAGLKARLAIEKAHVAAVESVLPKFEAFFGSLTDEQKAAMGPQQGRDGKHRPGNQQQGEMSPPPAGEPGAMMDAPPAPGDMQG